MSVKLSSDDQSIDISVSKAKNGLGYVINETTETLNEKRSVKIECKCGDGNGKWYIATKTCSNDGYCDCSDYKNPKIVCT